MSRFKMMALAAAAIATMGGAPTGFTHHRPQQPQYLTGGGRRRGGRSYWGKNGQARRDGIPKAFRQYCRRYHGTIA